MDDEDDKKWGLEARVREIDARLRRVEESIYDEGVTGQVLAQGGGKMLMKTTNNGRNGVESGGCESTEQN